LRKKYNVFIVFGTLPSLYAQINAIKDSKTESYIWSRSCGYFDYSKIPSIKHYYKMEGYDNNFINTHYVNIIEKIKEIKEKDSSAYFNIVIDDCRVQFLIHILESCSIKPKDYNLTLIMDGTLTEMTYRLLPSNHEEESIEKWNHLVNLSKNNFDKYKEEIANLYSFCFYLSTWKNVKLLTCYKELLNNNVISDDYKKRMHIENIDFEKEFKSLSIDKQNIFFGQEFTTDISKEFDSGKKNIIITGTYHFGYDDVTYTIYEQLILKALDYIDKDSIIWYKAHPLYPVDTIPKFKEFLEGNNIKILPPKFPLEILLWKYDNILLGGFCSTIYALINPKKVKFFFGEIFSFIKYLYDKNVFDAKIFNFEVSQKFAATISRYYYQNQDTYNKLINDHNESINRLDNRINYLEEELRKSNNRIDEMNSSFNWLRKISNKFRRKKEK